MLMCKKVLMASAEQVFRQLAANLTGSQTTVARITGYIHLVLALLLLLRRCVVELRLVPNWP